jgi:sigma-B regulation protein RsbU (phosphoserine phosphatase)
MLHRLNSFVLHQIRTTGFFFTLAAIRLEDHGHRLQFAGAGHPPAVLVNPRGDCRLLEARSAVLGLFDDAVAENPVEELALNPGDRVVLYTDGLCEVFNSSEDILGIERLRDIVAKNVASPLPQMKQAILDCVAQWRHGPVTDDTSLVLLELR